MESKRHIRILQAGLLASLFCFVLISCGDNSKVVASVDGTELTEADAWVLMRHLGYDPENKADNEAFIKQWCEQEALKKELEETNPELYKLVNLRADAYKGELAKFYLEEQLLMAKLDTTVSEKEIKAYYDQHKDEFLLSDYLVKALYLKVPKSVDYKSKQIDEVYLLKNDKDLSQVNSYAKLYAENFYFNDSSWIYFNELSKDIPLTKYNVDNIVLNRTKTYFSDDKFTYFLNIIDFTLKDDVPPMEFLSDQIKELIVLNRLQRLKEKNESKMIQTIKKKHEIFIAK